MPQIHCHQAVDAGRSKSLGVHQGILISHKIEQVFCQGVQGEYAPSHLQVILRNISRGDVETYSGSKTLQEDSAGKQGAISQSMILTKCAEFGSEELHHPRNDFLLLVVLELRKHRK